MSLATAGGTIGKNCSIVSIQNTVQQGFGGCFVDFCLGGIFVEYSVKGKSLIFDTLSSGDNGAGELLNRVVLGRIEYAGNVVSSRVETSYDLLEFLQAFIIDHFDYWSDAFLGELRSGSGSKRTIAQKYGSIVTFGKLRSLPNSERPNPNSDGDGRSTVGYHCVCLCRCPVRSSNATPKT